MITPLFFGTCGANVGGVEGVEFELLVDCAGFEATPGFRHAAEGIAAITAAVLEHRGIEAPAMRVYATGSLADTIAAEHARLEIPYDARRGLERAGATIVAGKALVAADGSEASVIVPVEYALADSSEGQGYVAGVLGHEFGHVAYGRQRDLALGRVCDPWLPWEVAETTAVTAAEEFRVGLIGFYLADQVLTLNDDAGEKVALASFAARMFEDGVADVLDALDPALVDTIWQYRIAGGSVQDLWVAIAEACGGVPVYLAHLCAASGMARTKQVLAELDHPGAELLRPVWDPLLEYLGDSDPIPEPDAWVEDHETLKRIGLEGFTEVWRQLGVAARPQGNGFYLSVDEPGRPAA